jgi:hypothetical protein
MHAMKRWNIVALAAFLGLTLALPASAQWKWRDKAGQTQYSDLPPPPSVPESDILQRPNANQRLAPAAAAAASNAASGAPTLAPKGSDPELEAKRRKAEQDVAAKKKAEDEKVAIAKADNSLRAKAQLRTLESGERIARTNDKGEREIMDDTARASEAKRTREVISADCK